jgi:hypothetical protein
MKRKKTQPGIVGQFTINGKPIEITDSWAKTTFGQYLRIMKLNNDTIELLSIITGLEYEYLKKAKITGMEKLLVASGFINTVPYIPTEAKKIGPFKLPLNSSGIFDIQFESLAQFEDMRLLMGKSDLKDPYQLTESYAKYCALYVQKLRDGEYDADKALAMLPEIMTYPAFDVISAGSFFFVRLWSLLNGTQPTSRNTTQTQTMSTGKRSKRSSVSRQRSTKRAKR